WNENKKLFLISSLSPAKITQIEIDEVKHKAKVYVEEKEAPLAIGKSGINVNLASRLTEFEIDIAQNKVEAVAPPTTETAVIEEPVKK
ncbi:MAG: hypothetical protein Q7R95_06800, partial [bacterium]|nr:hypothetical protein [bacterium]